MCVHAYSGFVHNCQKPGTTRRSFDWWMDIQTLVHLYHERQLSNKKEWTAVTYNNMCGSTMNVQCEVREVWRGGQFSGDGNFQVMGLFCILIVVVTRLHVSKLLEVCILLYVFYYMLWLLSDSEKVSVPDQEDYCFLHELLGYLDSGSSVFFRDEREKELIHSADL